MNTNVLESLLVKMERYLPFMDQCNSAVSSAPVGWHLAHSMQVINTVIENLKTSNPDKYEYEFSFSQILVFLTRRIPRGKARAPKSVRPHNNILKEDLKTALQDAGKNIRELQRLPSKSYFKHPYFRNLNRNETKKFLEIHTQHHLKIIKDITT